MLKNFKSNEIKNVQEKESLKRIGNMDMIGLN